MNVRIPFFAVSIAVLVLALVVDLVFPQYGTILFYGLIFWLLASFFLMRVPGVGPRPNAGAVARPPGEALPAPLPAGSSGPPVALGFCAFCGGSLPSGATKCPSCHHDVRAF